MGIAGFAGATAGAAGMSWDDYMPDRVAGRRGGSNTTASGLHDYATSWELAYTLVQCTGLGARLLAMAENAN
jgi:hypothetical protein